MNNRSKQFQQRRNLTIQRQAFGRRVQSGAPSAEDVSQMEWVRQLPATTNPIARAAFCDITSPDRLLVGKIVARAKEEVAEYQRNHPTDGRLDSTDWVQFAMDLMIVHHLRKMRLLQLLLCDQTDFKHELSDIHFNIDRPLCSFPSSVRLRFASINPSDVHEG